MFIKKIEIFIKKMKRFGTNSLTVFKYIPITDMLFQFGICEKITCCLKYFIKMVFNDNFLSIINLFSLKK